MRLKNNPKAKEAIENSPLCIKPQDNEFIDSKFLSLFNYKSLFLEIGCGKGQFLQQLSATHPDDFFIGIEQYESVLFSAIKKESANDNLRYLCQRAEILPDFFSPNSVKGIYLNFSDPWPKKRHSKRRLTSNRFLDIYNYLLSEDGFIEMKTDNENLYLFSLESLSLSPFFKIVDSCTDIYANSLYMENNIATEYETKFHNLGNPIYKIIISR